MKTCKTPSLARLITSHFHLLGIFCNPVLLLFLLFTAFTKLVILMDRSKTINQLNNKDRFLNNFVTINFQLLEKSSSGRFSFRYQLYALIYALKSAPLIHVCSLTCVILATALSAGGLLDIDGLSAVVQGGSFCRFCLFTIELERNQFFVINLIISYEKIFKLQRY